MSDWSLSSAVGRSPFGGFFAPTVIGFARLAPEASPVCVTGPAPVRLVEPDVSADAIGSGGGAALMRAAIVRVKQACRRTPWTGVWEYNQRAKAFDERRGFIPVGFETFRSEGDERTDMVTEPSPGEFTG